MQHKIGFILTLGLVYGWSAVAGDILGPKTHSHPGFFKLAIGHRVNDGTTLFDPTQAQLQAQNLRTSHEAISHHMPSAVAPARSTTSGTARLELQAESEAFQSDTESGILNYGPIRFGTPPQELPVYVSTLSGDTWVRSGCTTCSNETKLFNKEASNSYHNMGDHYTIKLKGGNVNAILSEDGVSVQGLLVQKQAFGIVSEPLTDSHVNISGMVGLGFSSSSVSKKPTFIENLIAAKALAKPIVSIHLARAGQKIGSEVCFGCFDHEKTTGSADSISWVPLVSNAKNWTVAMTGLSVNNNTVAHFPNVTTLVSTFYSGIDLPQNLAESFYSLIPGARPATEYPKGFFEFPCNSSISVSLTLGSSNFPLNVTDFVLGPSSSDTLYCIGGIKYRVEIQPNTAVIGDIFFRSWYTTLNYGNYSVGFSPSINNK